MMPTPNTSRLAMPLSAALTRRTLLSSIALGTLAQVVTTCGAHAMVPVPDASSDQEIDVRAYGAIFDGRDNTEAIRRAILAASISPSTRTVRFPPGDSLLTSTLHWPSGVRAVGAGAVNTRFRRIADYGDTFVFGDPVTGYVSGGAEGFTIYQDHGAGFFPPNTEGGFRNRATHGAHLNVHPDSHCRWTDILLIGLTYQVRRRGGLASRYDQVDCYGIHDPAVPALQETMASILIEGDLKAIPTDIEFTACRISGMTSGVRAIDWPAHHRSSDVVQNAGARYGLQIECCEGVRWSGGYIGAAADAGVRLVAGKGSILSAFWLDGTFVDSCGYAGLLIDPSEAGTSTQISWQPSEHNCQGNGFCAVTDTLAADADDGATNVRSAPSVVGLTVTGQFRAQVGPGLLLTNARSVRIDVNARAWNLRNFYSAVTSYDAFVVVGRGCKNVAITGILGGGMDGAGGHDAVAVRHDSAIAAQSRIHFGGITGLNTAPEAELR